MGIGTLAHTAGRLPLKELIRRLEGRGIDFVQLALTKAIADLDTGPGKLSPGLAHYIGEQFARAGLRIGVLGCYINPIHPDPEERRREINRFKEHLRFARDFGAPMVATETGDLLTYADRYPESYMETGWRILKAAVEELAEEAEKHGVTVAIEPVSIHTVSTPEKMAELLEAVPSGILGVVFDPVNLLTAEMMGSQEGFFQRCFRAFGDRIVLAHLKDAVLRDGNLASCRPGTGSFETGRFLDLLQSRKPLVDISLEEVTMETLDNAVRFVKTQSFH